MKSLSFLKIPPTAASALGTAFPGYRFHRLLSDDSVGSYFEASDQITRKPLIFKIMSGSPALVEPGFRESFVRHLDRLSSFSYANVLKVFHGGEKDGVYYFVSEAPAGGTLAEGLENIRLTEADAIRVAREICDGLTHLHGNGLTHGQLRPSNIWLDADARPKIGFSLLQGTLSSLESHCDPALRQHFEAPELTIRSGSYDSRADLYSVGIILHRLLTGTVPAADPRPASAIVGCQPRLDEIIRKATEPLPERRYADAAALSADLEACLTPPARKSSSRKSPAARFVSPAGTTRTSPAYRAAPSATPGHARNKLPHEAYLPVVPVRKLLARRSSRRPTLHRRSSEGLGVVWSLLILSSLVAALVFLICNPGVGLSFTLQDTKTNIPQRQP